MTAPTSTATGSRAGLEPTAAKGVRALQGTVVARTPATTDLPWSLCFEVFGQPITQGSKVPNGQGRPGVRDSNAKRLKPWRIAVKEAALDAMRLCDRFEGPVQVRLVFGFNRPNGHYRTGRNTHLLRDGAPLAPDTRTSGDLDKLIRSVFDAMTDGGVWRDDAQVVEVRARKTWAGEDEQATFIPGVTVEVRPVTR